MRIPEPIRHQLLIWARRRIQQAPDRVIGAGYMRRWHAIPRNRLANIYLHAFQGSDDDRALHDHPWPSCSIILQGVYWEHLPAHRAVPHGRTWIHIRNAGRITLRRARQPHRIQLPASDSAGEPVISLFITGPRVREWGFWCAHGWRHWRVFTDPHDSGQIGRGCE